MDTINSSFYRLYKTIIYKFIKYGHSFKDIDIIYNEVVNNINKLITIFDLSNPYEIYTLYIYMLYKGYLSNDNKYIFSYYNMIRVPDYAGISILCGTGVCANIAKMLNDILISNGINSFRVAVNTDNPELSINYDGLLRQEYSDKKALIDTFYYGSKEDITNLLESLLDNNSYCEIYMPSMLDNFLSDIFGNHAINIASYSGKCYILDPTGEMVYYYDKDKKVIPMSNFECCNITYPSNKIEYGINKRDIDRVLELDSSIGDKDIIDSVKQICIDNDYMFKKFYIDNENLYREVNEKVMKIRKK